MTLPQENIGEVTNSGIEIIATYRDRAGDFEWGITGNLTYAKNKVNYMDEAASTPAWQKTEGHPIDEGDYGYCEETGEPIGVARLMARPTATLSLEAQQRRELKQKMYGD